MGRISKWGEVYLCTVYQLIRFCTTVYVHIDFLCAMPYQSKAKPIKEL
jgi:hypothetical protein